MIPRAPMSERTKQAISMALRGRTKSPETRARMREAALGRQHSAETKAAIGAGQRAHRARTPQQLENRRQARLRRQGVELRMFQWRQDIADAWRISPALAADVLGSKGHWRRRKLHDPRISDGVEHGAIKWYPFLPHLRPEGYRLIHQWKTEHGNHQRL